MWSARARTCDWLVVFLAALLLRGIFALITADTYDPDEFVYLSLSRQMAHGAVPYQSFMFFHPPGILVILQFLHPLISLWWPLARVFILVVDSLSAVLVWKIGTHIFSQRQARIAGLVYACSPIALLAAVRVGQDPLITALGLAGVFVLLETKSWKGAVVAGACLGVAIWIKYPAAIFLPVYVAAAPRRCLAIAGAVGVTNIALFAPFIAHAHQLFSQSVEWQVARAPMDLWHRVVAILSFWLLLNPLALPSALRNRSPRWLLVGFAIGGLFGLASEVYYHYLDPVVPFAALISAPLLTRLLDRAPSRVFAATAVFLSLWSGAISWQPVQQGLGALSLSATSATVKLLDRVAGTHDVVLADQFEYAYLAERAPATNYFWDMRGLTTAATLERLLPRTSAVVSTPSSSPSYPAGFISSLKAASYVHIHVGSATVWLPQHEAERLERAGYVVEEVHAPGS